MIKRRSHTVQIAISQAGHHSPHSPELDVFIDGPNEHFTCLNQIKHLQKLAKRFKKIFPALIVMEATGGYETAAAIAFGEAELPFAIVFPRRVRQFALGLGMNAKTDDIDARVIAS